MSNNQNPEVMDKIQKKAEEAAQKMRDNSREGWKGLDT